MSAPATTAAPRPGAPGVASRHGAWLAPVLILAAAAALHAEALRAPFFADDYLFLDQVRSRSLIASLTSRDPIGNFVRPVGRQLWFWLLAHVGGERPAVFHAANLLLFLVALTLLFVLVRRLAGARTAAVATAFVALSEAADVPLRWSSGSQDLLAVVGALAALLLAIRGRPWMGAVALLAGLFAKETVGATPLIALLLVPGSRRERLRRVAPLAAAWPAWAAVWLVLRHPHTASPLASPGVSGVAAVGVHLLQTALGLEWRSDDPFHGLRAPLPFAALAAAALAVWLAGNGSGVGSQEQFAERGQAGTGPLRRLPARAQLAAGLGWAVLGAGPATAVASIWSAYYFLFALCGVGLVLGVAVARLPRAAAAGIVVALGISSHATRHVDEFAQAQGAWTVQSHVNRYYLVRGMAMVERYLTQLRRLHPTLPHGATVFYGGLPVFAGLQTADGPVLRWAYRDTSLRSYFLSSFAAAAGRTGPRLLFQADGDSLIERPLTTEMLGSVALSLLLADDVAGARAADEEVLRLAPGYAGPRALHAWLQYAGGDTATARVELRQLGMIPDPGPSNIDAAVARIAHGDTLGAVGLAQREVQAHALDPVAHALLADILVSAPSIDPGNATVEAYAARVLQPDASRHVWRWGFLQATNRHEEQAAATLRTFLRMGGDADDVQSARMLLADIERRLPGGDIARGELRRGAEIP